MTIILIFSIAYGIFLMVVLGWSQRRAKVDNYFPPGGTALGQIVHKHNRSAASGHWSGVGTGEDNKGN
jgi:hypothetical protein